MNELLKQAGLPVPRNGVDNLAFFQVQGNCLSPDVQDGDVLFATWRPMSVAQARLAQDELAVFLVERANGGQPCAVLKRWWGGQAGQHDGSVSLHCNSGAQPFLVSQVYLLANHVHLVQRGWKCNPELLTGTVYAGLDVWFANDVTRILASTQETMTASMRAAAPLNVETTEVYSQGFTDALRAVAIAFGVAAPSGDGWRFCTVLPIKEQQSGTQSLSTLKWR